MTPWTITHQASLSMEFSRQDYWSGLSFPYPEDLSDPEIKPASLVLQEDSLPSEPPEKCICISVHTCVCITVLKTWNISMCINHE